MRFALLALTLALVAPTLVWATGKEKPINLEALRTVMELAEEDIADTVLPAKFPWIIYFGVDDGEDVTAAAAELEGLVRVGFASTRKSKVLKALGVTAETAPQYRVYPFGPDKTTFTDYPSIAEAKAAAVASIPSDLAEFVQPNPQALQAFLGRSVQANKVPAVLFIEASETAVPELLRKIALWFGDKFAFSAMPDPGPALHESFGIKRVPQFQIMIPELNKESGEIRFHNAVFTREHFGALKFKNLVPFVASAIVEINKRDFWQEQPDVRPASSASKNNGAGAAAKAPEPAVELTAAHLNPCDSSKLGLCVVAFLHGGPDAAADRNAQLAALDAVRLSPANKGRPMHFMWVDAVCHPAVSAAFDIHRDQLPMVVAIAAKKQRFATHIGRFDAEGVGSFIAKVLAGKVPMADLVEFPAISADEDCAAVHASAAAAPVEEEIDLAELMASDDGDDNKDAAKAAKPNRAGDDDTDDNSANRQQRGSSTASAASDNNDADAAEAATMEAKRRRAEEEIARLNKMSNAKKAKAAPKKAKKKTAAKKKTTAKDEL